MGALETPGAGRWVEEGCGGAGCWGRTTTAHAHPTLHGIGRGRVGGGRAFICHFLCYFPWCAFCQNKGRPEMTDRRRRPEMTAALVSEHRLGRSLPSFPLGEFLRRVVYRENVFPSTLYQTTSSLSSSLSIPIFQHHANQPAGTAPRQPPTATVSPTPQPPLLVASSTQDLV